MDKDKDFIATLDGVKEDPRSVEEKERDYKTSDILAGSVIVDWKEKPEDEWITYTPREQYVSLSCMAQAGAKGFEVIRKLVLALNDILSAHPPYRSRLNFPEGGMYLQNLGDVYKKIGTNLESVDVSQNIGESQMNRDITCDTPYKIKGYGFPDKHNSIDDIAYAIEKFGNCIIVIHSNKQEYVKGIPEYVEGSKIDFGHGICAVDYFLHNGVKVIKIEDSTGHTSSLDGKGTRLLTEDFLLKRCAGSMYFTLEEPKYLFKSFMKKGFKSIEIKELQKRLNKENMASPALVIDGDFGSKTEAAVKNYQTAHKLVADGLVGVKTRAVLNK